MKKESVVITEILLNSMSKCNAKIDWLLIFELAALMKLTTFCQLKTKTACVDGTDGFYDLIKLIRTEHRTITKSSSNQSS